MVELFLPILDIMPYLYTTTAQDLIMQPEVFAAR